MICIATDNDHQFSGEWFVAIFYEGYSGPRTIVSAEVPD